MHWLHFYRSNKSSLPISCLNICHLCGGKAHRWYHSMRCDGNVRRNCSLNDVNQSSNAFSTPFTSFSLHRVCSFSTVAVTMAAVAAVVICRCYLNNTEMFGIFLHKSNHGAQICKQSSSSSSSSCLFHSLYQTPKTSSFASSSFFILFLKFTFAFTFCANIVLYANMWPLR